MPVFLLFAISTSLACFLMASIPSLTFILAIAWGAGLIISSLYLKRIQIAFIYGINVLLLYGIAGGSSLFFYLSFFGIAAFVMTFLSSYNGEYYYLQKWGIISAVLGVSLFVGLIYYSTGEIGISEIETQLESYVEDTFETYEDSGIFDFYEKQGINRAEFEDRFAKVLTSIARHLPAFYYLQAIMVVFFMLFLASYVSLKRNIERLKKKPFVQEIMPWQLAWVVIAGLGLWLWGKDQAETIFYTGSNILLVMAPITVYFGLAAIIYKLKQQKTRKEVIIAVLLILSILFPLSAIIFLGVIGLFDSLMDYRKLRLEKEDETR